MVAEWWSEARTEQSLYTTQQHTAPVSSEIMMHGQQELHNYAPFEKKIGHPEGI